MPTNARYFDFYDSLGYSLGIQGECDEEEGDDKRSEIIYAVTEIGVMTDFIKAHTMYTFEDYKWTLNPCMIRIMCADNTRIHYLSEKESKMRNATVINSAEDLINDLGFSVDISSNKD